MKSALRSMGLAVLLFAAYAVAQGAYSSPPMIETAVAVPAVYDSQPAFSEREVRCVQRTIFGEARNQSYPAQVAVGASLVTRSLSGNYPSDLCSVARQASQFKGYASGIALPNDIEAAAWDQARMAAINATYGYGALPDEYRSTMFFRRADEKVGWMNKFKVLGRLDDMVFYGAERSTRDKSA